MRRHAQRKIDHRDPISIRPRATLKLAATLTLALTFALALPGCGEGSSGGNSAATPDGVVTADNYKILHDVPGTPAGRFGDNIRVTAHMGIVTTKNSIHGLELTETQPPTVVEGHEFLKSRGYVKSRKLRIENFMEPDGSRMVQVNVSLSSPFALKSLRGIDKNQFVPSPLLQDTIGNSYWPSGYILRSKDGEQVTEIYINRGKQIKNLGDLPRLSRNKEQELLLLFFVNKGVTIESLSYGGGDPKVTFQLTVD